MAGDRIIVCLNANEDIYKKEIRKVLSEEGALAMKEVVGSYTGKKIGLTFFRGQLPIDRIWATSDITIANACIMPAGYGIGDHRLFVIDIHTSTLIVCVNLSSGLVRPFPILKVTKPCWTCLPPLGA